MTALNVWAEDLHTAGPLVAVPEADQRIACRLCVATGSNEAGKFATAIERRSRCPLDHRSRVRSDQTDAQTFTEY